MISSTTSANATVRQSTINRKRGERRGCTTGDKWVGFMEGLLDKRNFKLFTARYISHMGKCVKCFSGGSDGARRKDRPSYRVNSGDRLLQPVSHGSDLRVTGGKRHAHG